MAADGAAVLREFVATLGWKVDEKQLKGMLQNLATVTETVAGIAAAVTATAYVVDKYVTQMAKQFEKLYYSSERSGASVKSLQAMEYGAQQIGLAAGSATSMLEGMTSAMRSNPGLQAMFGDPGKDSAKWMISTLEGLKKAYDMGGAARAIAIQKGGLLGISEQDLNMLMKGLPELEKYWAARNKMIADAGLDPDSFALESKNFDNRMRTLQTSIEIVQVLIAQRFMPAIDGLLVGIGWIVQKAASFDKSTHGWSTAIGGSAAFAVFIAGLPLIIKTVLRLMGFDAVAGKMGGGLGGWAAKGIGGMFAEGGMLSGVGSGIGAVVAFLGGWPVIIGAAIVAALAYGLFGTETGRGLIRSGVKTIDEAVKTTGADGSGKGDPRGITVYDTFKPGHIGAWIANKVGYDLNNPGNIGGAGAMRSYVSANEGLTAIATQLLHYFGKGSNTLDTLIAEDGRYSPRSARNAKGQLENPNINAALDRMGKDMHVDPYRTHLTPDANTLVALVRGVLITEGHNTYGTDALQAAVSTAMTRGAGSRTLNSQTTVNVNGSGDPKAVGSHVVREQKAVHADAIRNLTARSR
jgi:hypothetical protein